MTEKQFYKNRREVIVEILVQTFITQKSKEKFGVGGD